MENTEIIKKFYESFASGNAEGMVDLYDNNIVFSDPAFGQLKGDNAKNMWRMLLSRNTGNIKISFNNIIADSKTGSADWQAEYVFSQTGRNVINKIHATFEFENAKITKHIDAFDIWKWSRQALGFKGLILGWSMFMKTQVQKQTNQSLKSFTKKKAAEKNW